MPQSRLPLFSLVLMVVILVGSSSITPRTYADESLVFTGVTPPQLTASTDYATDVRGQPWDFTSAASYSTALTGTSFVGGGSLVDGWFVGTSSNGDPKIWMQDLVGPHLDSPIDTSRYRYLSFRMCVSARTQMIVYWHRDGSMTPGSFDHTVFKPVAAGCQTYSYDLVAERAPGTGGLPWNAGPIQSIAIKPAIAAGITIKMDYARLSSTSPTVGPAVAANWQPAASHVSLFFDSDPHGSNPTLISNDVTRGAYTWVTPNLAPGTYYLIARSSKGQTISSPFVVNSPAKTMIIAPSYTSGPDYATTVLGNPWDMSSSADIASTANIGSISFKGGIFSGTNLNGNPDPQVYFKVGAPIDPARFYYVTYRMLVDGPMDIGAGSVARLFWKDSRMSDTSDILVYEGWRTVSIDLRSVPLIPGGTSWQTGGNKTAFRLDPHEFSTMRTFHIDDVKLTGADQASTSFPIRYQATDANGDALRTSFFAVTNRQGANAQAISCANTSSAPGSGRYKVYLPMVNNGVALEGQSCIWNVAGVPNGNYYIKMVVNDGRNITSTISDTPLLVRH